jgi:hypothetical protein
MTKAESIAQAFVAALKTVFPAADVYRDRKDALGKDEQSVVLIELNEEDSSVFGGNLNAGGITYSDQLRISVTYCYRADAWQTAVSGMRELGHSALRGNLPLNALVQQLRKDRARWDSASSDGGFGFCEQMYLVNYTSTHLEI